MLLYFHIPFCASKCGYCAFNSIINNIDLHLPYFQAMQTQLKSFLYHLNPSIESVFIGGGTPNIVNFWLYENLFQIFMPFVQKNAEITLEANPEFLNVEFIRHIQEYGVNRISMGVQSFSTQKLQWLERNATPHSIQSAFIALDQANFKNINIDLIYGTPFDDSLQLLNELESLQQLPITHLSAYHLSIENGSKFKQDKRQNYEGEEFSFLLEKAGWWQYEVSNYVQCKEWICQHNLGYWNRKEYIGVGAGAVGFLQNYRYTNLLSIQEYIKNPKYIKKEFLSSQEESLERLFLGLRCAIIGVKKTDVPNQENLDIAIKEGIVEERSGRIYAKSLLLADEIALFLS
ncbi:radical SAM family heme chaperone HemW [Helicobacter monodelphidis]|uniref:radical SAM family heme chaperone HemW n=1 Tax=Helicobacter sp. 15-1451 TaxID=2004995 RepID=UPI0015EB4624|nr:radical SAM family heme chaperone HemW [Helicobacter sp. 15-1451]